VNSSPGLPRGFRIGHWTDPEARTGCTVVLPPPGTRGSVDVRGGGTGTREIETLSPLANSEGPHAVLLTGGSAFGLAAADGVVRWLEERGVGRPTPGGVVPLVPAAVVFDLVEGSAPRRPGPAEGYAACEAAVAEPDQRGTVGAGAGAAVGKLFGRDRATRGGVGFAAVPLADGTIVAAVAVANAFGDVIGEDGEPLGAPAGEDGQPVRSARLLASMTELPDFRDLSQRAAGNTTLVCVCTDASVDSAPARSWRAWPAPASRAPSTRPSRRSMATWCSAWPPEPNRRYRLDLPPPGASRSSAPPRPR
jgi:L-aminopeptidase/D-esterase-like protein